jgi:hypothetical protein
MKAYHGTTSEFASVKLTGQGAEAGTFFATSSRKDALAFADMKAGESRVLTVEIELENPLVVDVEGETYDPEMMGKLIKRARAEGCDGLVVKRIQNFEFSTPSTTYVAFAAEQVKLA